MYTYSIFLFKDEVVTNYFYKTPILHRFIQEYWENRQRNFLQLQYNYITDIFTLKELNSIISDSNELGFVDKRPKQVKLFCNRTEITFYEDEKHLTLTCNYRTDLEDFLFPHLQKYHSNFFVICHQTNDYGWLSLKNHRVVKGKQKLIS